MNLRETLAESLALLLVYTFCAGMILLLAAACETPTELAFPALTEETRRPGPILDLEVDSTPAVPTSWVVTLSTGEEIRARGHLRVFSDGLLYIGPKVFPPWYWTMVDRGAVEIFPPEVQP